MTSRLVPPAALAAGATLILALAGCGGKVIDAKKTEAAVLAEVQVKTDTKIESVTCPTNVPVNPGTEFTCAVEAADGSGAVATLRIRNDQADVSMLSLEAQD